MLISKRLFEEKAIPYCMVSYRHGRRLSLLFFPDMFFFFLPPSLFSLFFSSGAILWSEKVLSTIGHSVTGLSFPSLSSSSFFSTIASLPFSVEVVDLPSSECLLVAKFEIMKYLVRWVDAEEEEELGGRRQLSCVRCSICISGADAQEIDTQIGKSKQTRKVLIAKRERETVKKALKIVAVG